MLFVVTSLADFFPNKKLTKKRRRPRQNIFIHPLRRVVVAILIFNFSLAEVCAADNLTTSCSGEEAESLIQ